MTVELERLRSFLGAGSDDNTTDELKDAIAVGRDKLEEYCADATAPVPSATYNRAHLLVAAELFRQGEAPHGIINQEFEDGTTTPVHVSSDPLRPVRSLLGEWVPPVTIA